MKIKKAYAVALVVLLACCALTFSHSAKAVPSSEDLFLEASNEWNSEGNTFANSVSLGDLDGNGDIEVVSVGRSTQGGQARSQLRIWGYDGSALSVLTDETFDTAVGDGLRCCKVDDVDDDGNLEIVTLGEVVSGGRAIGQLIVWRWDGVSLTRENSVTWQHATYNTRSGVTFAICDVDADGVKEIITGGGSDTPNIALLKIWNGQTLASEAGTNWITGGMARVHGVAAGDVDGDGQEEVVTTGEAGTWDGVLAQLRIWNWNGASLTLEHSHEWRSGGGHTRAYSVLADDVDVDGETEIVVGGHSIVSGGPWSLGRALLWIFRWDGASLSLEEEEWVSKDKWEASMPGISLTDMDDDGIQEICAVTQTFEEGASSVESGHIRIWSWASGSLTLEKESIWRTAGNTRATGIVVGDPDADGIHEVVTGGCTNNLNSAQLAVWSASEPPAAWSFAIIADPHIGGYEHNGDTSLWLDYGGPDWEESESGPEYLTTQHLRETVKSINERIEKDNIKFVVVLGDFADSAEASEFNKAKEILDTLDDDVPWIPVIGNHDTRPYTGLLNKAPVQGPPWPEEYFDDAFAEQYEKLEDNPMFGDFRKQPVPVEEPISGRQYYLQNFAFDYAGYHFAFLDFCSREVVPLSPGYWWGGRLWWEFEDGTFSWLQNDISDFLERNEGARDRNHIVLLSHHPLKPYHPTYDSLGEFAFKPWELLFLWEYIVENGLQDDIWGNFAGHSHESESVFYADVGLQVVETRDTRKGPWTRIVRVDSGGIDYSSDGPVDRPPSSPDSASEWRSIGGEDLLKPGDVVYDAVLNSRGYPYPGGWVRWGEHEPLGLLIGSAGIYVGDGLVATVEPFLGVGGLLGYVAVNKSISEWDYPASEDVFALRVRCSPSLREGAAIYAASATKQKKWYPLTGRGGEELVGDAYDSVGVNVDDGSPYEIFLDNDVLVIGGHWEHPLGEGLIQLVVAHSPVDLVLKDPDGLVVSKEICEIPGGSYIVDDIDSDESAEDIIAVWAKIGDYEISVLPEPDAAPGEMFTLEVRGQDSTKILAENRPISDLPATYTFNSAELQVPPTTSLLASDPSFINDQGILFANSDTKLTLTGEDNPNGSGLAYTAYKIYNETFDAGQRIYVEPFSLASICEGNYSLEFYSIDNLGNLETANTIRIVLFSWTHIFEDSRGRETTLRLNSAYRLFQFAAPDKDFGVRQAPKMTFLKQALIVHYEDSQMRLTATAICNKDFCVAIVNDKQTSSKYLLVDEVGIES